MKSNVCKIENGTRDLEAILKESERVAEYNGLSHKQALQLRLLCEEIDGMLPNIVDDFEGELWIDFEDGVSKINVSIEIPEFNIEKKEALIGIAKNKKNAAIVGIVGKIRDAIENFFLDQKSMEALAWSTDSLGYGTGCSEGMDYAYYWRLEEYRSSVKKEEKSSLTMFEQPAGIIETASFEVQEVLPDGHAIAKSQHHSFEEYYTDPTVLLLAEETNPYYDKQIVKVPKGKSAYRVGSYQYEPYFGSSSTLPVVRIMSK